MVSGEVLEAKASLTINITSLFSRKVGDLNSTLVVLRARTSGRELIGVLTQITKK